MNLPELETERLRLVVPTADQIDHYREFFTNAAASSNYGGPLTIGQSWTRLAHDRGVWHLRGFGVWLVQTRDSDETIGGCGFWQGVGWPRELTWWLLPSARGHGYAAEASRAAINHAYSSWDWSAVQTYMSDDNEAARSLVLRLGGREATRHVFPDGDERSMYLLPRRDGTFPDTVEFEWT